MKEITYVAVLEPGKDGSFSISFPDLPGCFSHADSITEVGKMAAEAASIYVYSLEVDGEEVPKPSSKFNLKDFDTCYLVPVTIYPELFRQKRDNERVKTNTTIPLWLKRAAEERNVNFSRVLENALIEYLKLQNQNIV